MSYVDALYEKDNGIIKVVERINDKRIFNDYPAEYIFYYKDRKGKFRDLYNNKVSKFVASSLKEFNREKRIHTGGLCESDITPLARCLEKNYKGIEPPVLHTAFFDIEVDFDNLKGHSPVEDPFNRVTAISTFLNWTGDLVTQVLPPKSMPLEEANEICEKFENCLLYTDEKQMLNDWLDLIDDADVLSGWNSEGYDIPYMVNRVARVLSKNDTRRFCLWDKLPKKRIFERFGGENTTYDLLGRIHLDYMQLYRKYTYHEMHSYSLDAIGEHELNERKVPYTGTLDQLYNNDFEKFIEYNRQDTLLINKLDQKLKFIDLANTVAHDNTVLIPKTMGVVAVTEQAIINEAHSLGFVIPDKNRSENEDIQAAGAYVAYPKKGLHKWIGSLDINSLYPSTFQALNMSPETIVGQLRPDETNAYIREKMRDKPDASGKIKKGMSFGDAWEGLFGTLEYTAVMERREDVKITIDWEPKTNNNFSTFATLSHNKTEATAKEVYELIFESNENLILSANGTIFTCEKEGIIPGLLKRWYAERKTLQRNLKFWKEIDKGIDLPDDLSDIEDLL